MRSCSAACNISMSEYLIYMIHENYSFLLPVLVVRNNASLTKLNLLFRAWCNQWQVRDSFINVHL